MLCAMHFFFCACATLDKRNFNDFRETTTEEVQAVETTETKTKEVKEVEKTEEKEEEVTFLWLYIIKRFKTLFILIVILVHKTK